MPVIFEARCASCGHTSPVFTGFYRAILVDEASSSNHTHPEIKQLVVLAHPNEHIVLEELGYTCEEAAAALGRLVMVKEVFCRSCGTFYERRKLTAGATAIGCTGCLTLLLLAALGGVLFGYQSQDATHGLYVSGSLAWLFVVAIELFFGVFIRWRFRERASALGNTLRCPRCGDRRTAWMGWLGRPIACPHCGQKAVRIQSVGVS
jgi:hypothetical protein